MNGFTFDAGGLIALDRHDRRVVALLDRAERLKLRVTVPATALAQALRRPATQVRLARLLAQKRTDVVPLDAAYAEAVGQLLAVTGTSDITDAHVAICAEQRHQDIVTSDPDDLRRLAPNILIHHV